MSHVELCPPIVVVLDAGRGPLKVDNPRIIHDMFALKWLNSEENVFIFSPWDPVVNYIRSLPPSLMQVDDGKHNSHNTDRRPFNVLTAIVCSNEAFLREKYFNIFLSIMSMFYYVYWSRHLTK